MLRLIFTIGLLVSVVFGDKITVFAAADLRFALDEVKEAFLKQNPSHEMEMIYGSSGKGLHQVENGAPYHLYYSANEAFVEKLYSQGDIITKPRLYALGRVVIWSTHPKFDANKGFDNLNESWVKKIAIASPAHAPYGEKAKQALESLNLYKNVETKLVLGENISHTAQFVQSGAADIGIIALSLALAPTIADSKTSSYYLIDDKLHEPLLQGYGITKYAKDSKLAFEFYDFTLTDDAMKIMKKYGFETPKDN
ncbi:molybdate ABC transporter substrate-binding protein [Arcobacter sp. FWKO B]|uniref:molybdate ABC transporter substrate-binding protein n=1 Tax=Arcobacter sp. FWKO B TaxID=2593672 RepID=UPI0018A454E1|nr:molybdate ABC transporter substrate-binding protein [Arcobacter sp. FWKO B]QOG12422.1 molybdate ABC transporter substrate-binding protein [Arcobacter sp. FWKO B]